MTKRDCVVLLSGKTFDEVMMLAALQIRSTERREDGEKEISPHTPLIGKEGEEKKARDSSRACEDDTENPPRFKKPTIPEIAEYCEKRKNGIDAEEFWHFYESKGWKVGKSPMKDWTSAVITWERVRKRDAASQPSHFGKGQATYVKPTQEDIDKSKGVL